MVIRTALESTLLAALVVAGARVLGNGDGGEGREGDESSREAHTDIVGRWF